MTSQYDVAIIGGGVIGTCCAHYLAQRGAKVLLIEKNEIASGCSSGNAGLIVPSYALPLASPRAWSNGLRWMLDAESPFYIKPRLDLDLLRWLIHFMRASREEQMMQAIPVLRDVLLASRALYDELAQRLNAEFGFEGNGSLHVYLTERAFQEGMEEAHLLEKFEIASQVMNAADVHDLEPSLSRNLMGGVFYPQDGHMDPLRFVNGLADKLRELGVELLTGTEVGGFELENRKIKMIKTPRGELHADQVILAAGSWSPEIARMLKLNIPIQPGKGYSITFEKPVVSPKIPLLFGEAAVAVNLLKDAVRVAGTLELAGMDFSINMQRVKAMQRAAERYLPGLAGAQIIESWCGLRPATPDGLPIISRSDRLDNLLIAVGHGMLGMSLGPITGKLVSQLVCEEKPDINLAPFTINRF